MSAQSRFHLTIIYKFIGSVWPFSNWSSTYHESGGEVHKPQINTFAGGSNIVPIPLSQRFWNYQGIFIGRRDSDGLFRSDGHQIGYIAEGNEIYGGDGRYLGEVRGRDRLVTNLSKKAWARRVCISSELESTSDQPNVPPIVVPSGFEDFPSDL